jgi:hypothetical protein
MRHSHVSCAISRIPINFPTSLEIHATHKKELRSRKIPSLVIVSGPRSPAISVHVVLMRSEAASFLDCFLLVPSRLNPRLDVVIGIWDALRCRLGCSNLQFLVTLSTCVLGEVHDGLEAL